MHFHGFAHARTPRVLHFSAFIYEFTQRNGLKQNESTLELIAMAKNGCSCSMKVDDTTIFLTNSATYLGVNDFYPKSPWKIISKQAFSTFKLVGYPEGSRTLQKMGSYFNH